MNKQLDLKVFLDVLGNAVKPLKKIKGESTLTAKALKDAKDNLKQLNRQQKDVSGMVKLQRSLASNNHALDAANRQLAALNDKVAKNGPPTKRMATQLAYAQTKVNKLAKTNKTLNQSLSETRGRLVAAGIPVKNLALQEQILKTKLYAANGEISKQNKLLAQQANTLKKHQAIARKQQQLKFLADRSMQRRNNFAAAGATGVATGVGLAAPVLSVTKQFAILESANADFKASMMQSDGTVNKHFNNMSKLAEDLGTKLPGTTTDYIQMMQTLVQQGQQPQMILDGLGKATAYLGVQLKMSMSEAALFTSKLQDATGASAKEMMGLTDQIQRIANLGVESNAILIGFSKLSPVLSVIKQQGLQAVKTLSPLLVMADQAGMAGEAAGNAYRKIIQGSLNMKKLAKGNEALAGSGISLNFADGKGEFAGLDNMFKQLAKLKNVNSVKRLEALREIFGDDAETQQALAIMIDKGQAGYDASVAKMEKQASLQKRVNVVLGTLTNLWDAASGTFINALAFAGEAIGPDIKKLVDMIGTLSEKMGNFAKAHPQLVGFILKTVAALAALSLVGGGLMIMLAGLMGPFAMVRYGLGLFALKGGTAITILKALKTVVFGIGRAIMMIPLVRFAVLLGTAVFMIYKYWEPITGFFTNLWERIKRGFFRFINPIIATIQKVKSVLGFQEGGTLQLATAGAPKPTTAPQLKRKRNNGHVDNSSTSFTINAAPGMDAKQIADEVDKRINHNKRQAAARRRSSLTDQE